MQTLETLILIVHVLAALSIIGLVLIQQGKGAEMGAGFGAGSSGTVFGSGGVGNFLTRLTTAIAITFFLTSFGLAFYAREKSKEAGSVGIPEVTQPAPATEEPELPAVEDEGDTGAAQSEIPEVEEVPSEVPESGSG